MRTLVLLLLLLSPLIAFAEEKAEVPGRYQLWEYADPALPPHRAELVALIPAAGEWMVARKGTDGTITYMMLRAFSEETRLRVISQWNEVRRWMHQDSLEFQQQQGRSTGNSSALDQKRSSEDDRIAYVEDRLRIVREEAFADQRVKAERESRDSEIKLLTEEVMDLRDEVRALRQGR